MSDVGDDIFAALEHTWSRRVVLQRLLGTVCGDIFVALEQAFARRLTCERVLSAVWGDLVGAFEHAWSRIRGLATPFWARFVAISLLFSSWPLRRGWVGSVFSALLGALSFLLSRLSGREDVVLYGSGHVF